LKSKDSKKVNSDTYNRNVDKFKKDMSTLFDITACKCKEFKACSCPRDEKVPKRERMFLKDQRTKREMVIGSVDVVTSSRNARRDIRNERDESRLVASQGSSETIEIDTISNVFSSSDSVESEGSQYEPSSSTKRRILPSSKNPTPLKKIAILADKTGVSDRAAATIASAVLVSQAGNEEVENVSHLIIDRNKIRRAKKKSRTTLQDEPKVIQTLESIYFDGRKDFIRVRDEENRVKSIKEEHISIIQEPGSHYLGHVTPSSGHARSISSSIVEFFKMNEIDFSQVITIGCDGTAVNTGQKGGIIKLLDK